MTRIDPALFTQIAALQARGRRDEANSASAARSERGRTSLGVTDGPLLARIRQLVPDDPNRRAKAFRYFLESRLSTTLGMRDAADPVFLRVVEDIHQQMAMDRRLSVLIDQAVDQLLAEVAQT